MRRDLPLYLSVKLNLILSNGWKSWKVSAVLYLVPFKWSGCPCVPWRTFIFSEPIERAHLAAWCLDLASQETATSVIHCWPWVNLGYSSEFPDEIKHQAEWLHGLPKPAWAAATCMPRGNPTWRSECLCSGTSTWNLKCFGPKGSSYFYCERTRNYLRELKMIVHKNYRQNW